MAPMNESFGDDIKRNCAREATIEKDSLYFMALER